MRVFIYILLFLISVPAYAVENAVVPQVAAQQAVAPPAATAAAATPQSYIFNLTYEDAEDAIGKALTEKAENGKIVSAIISGKKAAPLYSYNKPISVEVRGLRADSEKKSWSASLVVLSEGAVISAMPLSGRYSLMVEVPVLTKSLRAGEIITEADIERKIFPYERIHGDNVTDSGQLLGKSAVRSISPNRPIRISEVSAPAVIKKNALVQMRYKTANMEITTAGQAMKDGAKGDVIEVKNTNSKKIIQAVVVDANTVDVIVAQGAIK